MSKKISLRQFLVKTGAFDKVYDCVSAIRSGRVTIKGNTITNPNYFFNPKKSLVELDGTKSRLVPKLYFLLNKPAGYLSQKSENEKIIYDLLENLNLSKKQAQSLFAVGRLDKETEGLMILTNDGNLSDKIANPKNKIIKKYYAVLENPVANKSVQLLEKGVIIEIDGIKYKTAKCKIRKIKERELYISITEGKKRQVRKMFEAIGNKVVYLKRVSIGGLLLGDLKAGEIKQITRGEIMKKLEH